MGGGVGSGLSPVALVNHAKERGLSSPLLSSTGGLENPRSVLDFFYALTEVGSGAFSSFRGNHANR